VVYENLKLDAEVKNDCRVKLDKEKSMYELFRRGNYVTWMGDDWMNPYAWPNCKAFDGMPTTHMARYGKRIMESRKNTIIKGENDLGSGQDKLGE
jgi:hypothetical protein